MKNSNFTYRCRKCGHTEFTESREEQVVARKAHQMDGCNHILLIKDNLPFYVRSQIAKAYASQIGAVFTSAEVNLTT